MASQSGNVFVLKNNGTTVSTAITVLQLKAGANNPAEIIRLACTQSSSTTSAGARIALLRKSAAATVTAAVAGTTVVGYGNTGLTPAATLATSGTGITATAEGTNGEIIVQRGFNILNGIEWLPTPEERIIVPAGGIVGLTFLSAPTSATYDMEIVFRELG